MIGTLCAAFILKETNQKDNKKDPKDIKSFKFINLVKALKRPVIGTAIFTGFLLTMAQFTMIIGFQTFSVDVLKDNTRDKPVSSLLFLVSWAYLRNYACL